MKAGFLQVLFISVVTMLPGLCTAADAPKGTPEDPVVLPPLDLSKGAPSREKLEDRINSAVAQCAKIDEGVRDLIKLLEEAQRIFSEKHGYKNQCSVEGKRRRLWWAISDLSATAKETVDAMDEYYPPTTKAAARATTKPWFSYPYQKVDKVTFPDADATTPEEFSHVVADERHGERYLIEYRRFSIFTEDCKIYYGTGDSPWELDPAKYKTFDRGPDRTYIGRVKERPHWCAIGYVRENKSVRGLIFTDRRQGWMDFEGNKVIRYWLDPGNTKDNWFKYDSKVALPGPGAGRGPVYEVPMGVEISYASLTKTGGSIPALFELVAMTQMELVLAFWADCRIHVPIKHVNMRINEKTCPSRTRWRKQADGTYTKGSVVAPEEYFPDLTLEARSAEIEGDKIFPIIAWPKIWPGRNGCLKVLSLCYGASAEKNGIHASTHLYPSLRPVEYSQPPYTTQFATHTYLHEFAHTFGGEHESGKEEGMSIYAGSKPGPNRAVGSQVNQYRNHCKQSGFAIRTNTSQDIQLPPYACIDMLAIKSDNKEVTLDVLANDWDYNGDAIRLVAVDCKSRWGGGLKISAGKIIYNPPLYTSETDTFKYRISDSSGWEASGRVVIDLKPQGDIKVFTCRFDRLPFSKRSDGLEYGWPRRLAWNSPFFGPEGKEQWELTLADGKYRVCLCAGTSLNIHTPVQMGGVFHRTAVYHEGAKINHVNHFDVEGVSFVGSGGKDAIDYMTGTVTVSDGRLTIRRGAKGKKLNPLSLKVCKVE